MRTQGTEGEQAHLPTPHRTARSEVGGGRDPTLPEEVNLSKRSVGGQGQGWLEGSVTSADSRNLAAKACGEEADLEARLPGFELLDPKARTGQSATFW